MKKIILIFSMLMILYSCSNKSPEYERAELNDDKYTHLYMINDTVGDQVFRVYLFTGTKGFKTPVAIDVVELETKRD